jgi:hypothetical protein
MILHIIASKYDEKSEFYERIEDGRRTYVVVAFGVFLGVYVIALMFLVLNLKQGYPKFYLRERTRIFITSSFIILSLMSRVILNVILQQDWIRQRLIESAYDNTWFYPVVQVIS